MLQIPALAVRKWVSCCPLNQELFKPQLSRMLSISSPAQLHNNGKEVVVSTFLRPGQTTHWMTKEHLQGHYLVHSSLSTYSRYADATIHEGAVRLVARVADAWLCIISESTGPFLNIHHLCQVNLKAPRWKHKIQRNPLRQCSRPRGCRCTSCPRRSCSVHLNHNQCCSFRQLYPSNVVFQRRLKH